MPATYSSTAEYRENASNNISKTKPLKLIESLNAQDLVFNRTTDNNALTLSTPDQSHTGAMAKWIFEWQSTKSHQKRYTHKPAAPRAWQGFKYFPTMSETPTFVKTPAKSKDQKLNDTKTEVKERPATTMVRTVK